MKNTVGIPEEKPFFPYKIDFDRKETQKMREVLIEAQEVEKQNEWPSESAASLENGL